MPFFKKSTRREFLVAGSSAALAAATTAVSAQTDSPGECATEEPAPAHYSAKDLFEGAAQRTFSGEMATQVAMPLGGIGTGAICLNGNGGLQDYSIRERPETTALPQRHLRFCALRDLQARPSLLKDRFRSLRSSTRDCKAGECTVQDTRDCHAFKKALL